ncbi:hypothetical protein CEXT_622251 [Caerostris extrusa]|uniref:Uncharacterized protein n=1 Tax=Caerostris extrusa TaxID=172846 RepID=A0AAV4YBK1_CAEEX|nr:hypothetical protein CEXT_622251 [Caerostris extrusa]
MAFTESDSKVMELFSLPYNIVEQKTTARRMQKQVSRSFAEYKLLFSQNVRLLVTLKTTMEKYSLENNSPHNPLEELPATFTQ